MLHGLISKTEIDYAHRGVLARPHNSDVIINRHHEMEILVVTAHSHRIQKSRAHKTARIANLETRYDQLMFSASDMASESNGHVFLLRRVSRIVGFARLDLRTHVWRCSWVDFDNSNFPPVTITGPIWSLSFVWIHVSSRRSGAARSLVHAACRHLHVDELGFQTPFSDVGAALARRLSPHGVTIAK